MFHSLFSVGRHSCTLRTEQHHWCMHSCIEAILQTVCSRKSLSVWHSVLLPQGSAVQSQYQKLWRHKFVNDYDYKYVYTCTSQSQSLHAITNAHSLSQSFQSSDLCCTNTGLVTVPVEVTKVRGHKSQTSKSDQLATTPQFQNSLLAIGVYYKGRFPLRSGPLLGPHVGRRVLARHTPMTSPGFECKYIVSPGYEGKLRNLYLL